MKPQLQWLHGTSKLGFQTAIFIKRSQSSLEKSWILNGLEAPQTLFTNVWNYLICLAVPWKIPSIQEELSQYENHFPQELFVCCCSVAQSRPTLCDLVDCSMPGSPVLHYLLEFAQTPVHWVDDAIQPSKQRQLFNSVTAWGSDNGWANNKLTKESNRKENLKEKKKEWDVHRGFEKLSLIPGDVETEWRRGKLRKDLKWP